jgi:4-amino-4-deoxy-L-arabinose transferase-like glycosyltransferase
MSSFVVEQRAPTGESDSGASEPARANQTVRLGWILVAGAIVRIALVVWFQDKPIRIDDEQDYNQLAVSLVERGEYGYRAGIPATLRPPLYPGLVAAVYWAFGSENFQAIRCVQVVISLLNVVLLYRLGEIVFSRATALWSSGLYCFYPSLLGFNNLVLTEVLFTFLLCGTCLCLVEAIRRGSIVGLFLAGIVMGLAALTRSVVWLLPAVLGVFFLVAWGDRMARRILAIVALVMGFSATVAPWAARNSRIERTFTVIDTMGGRNFMMGNYEYTPMFRAWDAISIEGDRSWHGVLAAKYSEFRQLTQGQRDKLAMREGVGFVLANPGLTMKRDVVKFFQFWGLERELIAGAGRGYFGSVSLGAVVLLTGIIFGTYAATMISAVFGIVMFPPANWRGHWLLLLVVAFICGMHTLVFSHSRYHLPLIPLLLGYSASALRQVGEIWARRRQGSFWVAAIVSCALVGGWATEIVFVDLDRYLNMVRALS